MLFLLVLCLVLLVACCFTSDTIGYMLFFPPAVMVAVIMLYIVYNKLSALEKKINISNDEKEAVSANTAEKSENRKES